MTTPEGGGFNDYNKLEVGIAGTMMDIIELQKIADKIITL